MEKMYLVECWLIRNDRLVSTFHDSCIVATAQEAIARRKLYAAQKFTGFNTVVDTTILKPEGTYDVCINFGHEFKNEKRRFIGLKNMLKGVKEAFKEKGLEDDYGYTVISKTYFRHSENYAEYDVEVFSLW